jgi:hypothetical protein
MDRSGRNNASIALLGLRLASMSWLGHRLAQALMAHSLRTRRGTKVLGVDDGHGVQTCCHGRVKVQTTVGQSSAKALGRSEAAARAEGT